MAAPRWIFIQNVLQAFLADYPDAFAPGTIIYENIGQTGTPDTVTNATVIPYEGNDSFALFSNGTLNAAATGHMYDNENWSSSPPNEQNSPRSYMVVFAQQAIARGCGSPVILVPANDLGTFLYHGGNSANDIAYVQAQIPQMVGEVCVQIPSIDLVWNIQAQSKLPGYTQNGSTITSIEVFTNYILTCISAARAGLAKATTAPVILAGITLNSTVTTAPPLIEAVDASYRYVQGYWFNVPGSSWTSAQLAIVNQVVQEANYKYALKG